MILKLYYVFKVVLYDHSSTDRPLLTFKVIIEILLAIFFITINISILSEI